MTAKTSAMKTTKPEDKIARTDKAARLIISAEDEARRSKTRALRAARLAKEAEEAAAAETPAPKKKTKPAATKKTRAKA